MLACLLGSIFDIWECVYVLCWVYVLYAMFLVCVCGKFVCGIFLGGTLGDVHGANEVWSLLFVLLFFNFGS